MNLLVTYEFADGDGELVQEIVDVERARFYDRFEVGAQIDIVRLPDNPRSSYPAACLNENRRLYQAILAALVLLYVAVNLAVNLLN